MTELLSADHLSDLALEALEAGERWPGSEHLDACSDCRSRREAVRASTLALNGQPRFDQMQKELQAAAARAPVLWNYWAWGAGVAAVGAILAVAIWVPLRAENTTKGGPSLAIVAPGPSDHPVRPGDRVHLRAGGAGHPYGLVYGVDVHCQVELLWPTGGQQAAPVRGLADLGEFEVTPDPMRLWAIFFDDPIQEREVGRALASKVAEACRAGQPGTQAVPDRLPLEAGRADLLMQ
jgi:hypothetical protein